MPWLSLLPTRAKDVQCFKHRNKLWCAQVNPGQRIQVCTGYKHDVMFMFIQGKGCSLVIRWWVGVVSGLERERGARNRVAKVGAGMVVWLGNRVGKKDARVFPG